MAEPTQRHPKDGHPVALFTSQEEFEAWLERHVAAPAVWVQFAKVGNPAPSLRYEQAVESALCFGWVDGLVNRWQEGWYVQRFSPRRARSVWSAVNVAKAEALVKAGRMRPAGLAAIERAKAAGYWAAAYEGPATIEVPEDLQRFLDEHPEAARFFAGLSAQNRYAILFRLKTAVRPQTRRQRFDRFTAMLLAGETLYP